MISDFNAFSKILYKQGKSVYLRVPVEGGKGRTSGLILDGISYDIYTPRPNTSIDNITTAVRNKNTQASGVVIDLTNSKYSIKDINVERMLRRIHDGSGGTNIKEIILLKNVK